MYTRKAYCLFFVNYLKKLAYFISTVNEKLTAVGTIMESGLLLPETNS